MTGTERASLPRSRGPRPAVTWSVAFAVWLLLTGPRPDEVAAGAVAAALIAALLAAACPLPRANFPAARALGLVRRAPRAARHIARDAAQLSRLAVGPASRLAGQEFSRELPADLTARGPAALSIMTGELVGASLFPSSYIIALDQHHERALGHRLPATPPASPHEETPR